MTVVYEDLDLPGGGAPLAEVSIELAGNECRPIVGYHSVSHAVIGTLSLKSGQGVAANGYWEVDLVPNSEIVPANTVYRFTRRAYDGVVDVVCATVPIVTGAGGVSLGSLAPESPGGVDPTALAVHTSDLFAHGDVHEVSWWSTSDWDRLEVVPVTEPEDSIHVLSASLGTGVVTGSPGGNDRILYLLDGTEGLTDVEAYVDIELTGTAQGGLALSADEDTAILLWTNILLANAVLIPGIWEYDGVSSLSTNQQSPTLDGFKSSVTSATGDGTTLTVRTVLPHYLTIGQIVHFDSSFGGFGQFTVAGIIDETTFTVASVTAGSWTGGTVRMLFLPGRFKLATRRVGSTLTYKHWLPGQEEPTWNDTLKAATITLPTSLAGGGTLPTRGRVGVLAAHLNGTVRFSNLRIRDLTRSNTWPAVDDQQLHTELGLLTTRIDLRSNSTNPGVAWVADPLVFQAAANITAGTLYLAKIPIDRSRLVTLLHWWVSTAAVTPTAGQNWVGVYDSLGTRISQAGVDADTTSTGLRSTSIGSTTVSAPHVWAALLVNAATPPQIPRAANSPSNTPAAAVANVGMSAALRRFAVGGTGLTTLPTSLTPASLSVGVITAPWAALS